MKRIFTRRMIELYSPNKPNTTNKALRSAFERGFIVGLLGLDTSGLYQCPYVRWGHGSVFYNYWHNGHEAGADLREDLTSELGGGK